MINVNQITAQMARMGDTQLQRYAQMNKSDPYIVSLALSEANRRKEIRNGAQMNAPQQAKVVDQELAGMAQAMPENVGIGQLPAQNLQGMATGGIVAFDEGGEVPRYKDDGLVTDPFGIPDYSTDQYGRKEKVRAGEKYSPSLRGALFGYDIQPARAPIEGEGVPASVRGVAPAAAATTGQTPPAAEAAPAADKNGLYALTKPAFVPGQGLGLASSPTTLKQEFQSLMPEGPVVDPFEARTKKLGEERIKGAEEAETLRKKQVEELGLAGLDQERRLKAREEKLGKSEGELGGMALLKAGFAMMSGTSPHGLANIGIGANVGLEDYAKGREKIDAARERLDDANARLEQMRRGETMMNQREQRVNMKDISAAKVKAEEEGIAGLRQALGIQREDARTIYTAWNQQTMAKADMLSRERTAQAQMATQKDIANMLPGEARVAMLLGTGKNETERLQSGLEAMNSIKDRMTESKLAELYVKHKKDAEATAQTPLSPAAFAQAIKSAVAAYNPKVVDVPNADAGKVYGRPGT
jgi:hypothetical protein